MFDENMHIKLLLLAAVNLIGDLGEVLNQLYFLLNNMLYLGVIVWL